MMGRLSKIAGKQVTVTVDDDVNLAQISHLSQGMVPAVELHIIDKRKISPDQRKKIWALLNDLCNYTGDVPEDWAARFKYKVQLDFGVKPFSLSDCSVVIGNYMILEILDFLFAEDIPFQTKLWDSLPEDFPRQRLCLRNRTCVICGRPHADLAHYTTVGMGRNRRTIDERKMYFMTLCRKHHQYQHQVGIQAFCQQYHIKPLKLSDDDLLRFKILTNRELQKLQENDRD